MRRTWRTIRQHYGRSRSGQVSAVATVLALMLFVSFLSTFVLGSLGSQMTQKEFQHQLQVENQMAEFQTALMEAAAIPGGSVVLSSPVTLGSGGAPPFGTPSSGYVSEEPTSSVISAGLAIANITPSPPTWNTGSGCFSPGGNGTCSGNNGPILYWNFSGSHDTVTPGVNGCGSSGCTIVYNISGNFDTIGLTLKGNNLGDVSFVLYGNWDNMTLAYQGSCNNHRVVNIFIVGTNDTYALAIGGCASGVGASISTTFIGSLANICPYSNRVTTDHFLGATWGSSKGVYQNLTWRNAVGYVTPPHTIPTNGGNDFLTYANTTGFSQCPFTKAVTTGPYDLEFLSGIKTHLNNRYIAPSDVALDEGAEILGIQNGGSVMLSPPPVSYLVEPWGVSLSLELTSITGNSGIATGVSTAAVLSQVLSVQTFHIRNAQASTFFLTYLDLNITTAYPQAWATFWNKLSTVVPSGTTCVPGSGVPASKCLTPPYGHTSTIVVPLAVSELYLTTIVAQVSIY